MTETYDPKKHVIVPREPTHEMIQTTGWYHDKNASYDQTAEDYKSMVEAVPPISPYPVTKEEAEAALDQFGEAVVYGDQYEDVTKLFLEHRSTIRALLQAAVDYHNNKESK